MNNLSNDRNCIYFQEFHLPLDFNYENLTILTVSSCVSVNLHLRSLPTAKGIRDITIQNISGTLIFNPSIKSRKMGTFHLRNIGEIPVISREIFTVISTIDSFIIENTKIINFNEQFTNINIDSFILQNVTIENMVGINFSGQGETFKIINSIIRNVGGNLNFVFFEEIEIVNSTFEFTKPGDMSIEGVSAKIIDCIFSNVSMNLVARGNIVIKNNCADGKSSLRLSSSAVNSFGNKLPTEIIYTQNRSNSILFRNVNNTVCIAGNCKCPKSAGYNSHYRFHANIYLGIALLVVSHGLQSILDSVN